MTPTSSHADFLPVDDGQPAVRLRRTYPHPVGRVWEFVSDPAELARWFPSRVAIDPKPGGEVRFSFDAGMPDSTGEVLAAEAPRHLAFTWGPDELRFDLEAFDGGTRLTLTNVLAEENTAARNAAGWDVCLDALDAAARGEAYDGPHAGPTPEWRAYYAGYVTAGFPSGAPVPGLDSGA
ncbi:hypothetical protein GCM10023205_62680 [Yinghuangia aomiensis]|uniref:Activator of Hsp90 ATPase homologue 1/2-like C-terminal domain-containing protein n=1 Tax=Yinghuangia aomiensis TaxID=676205 RepID=A0ABP9I1J8_9ACTN